MRLLNVVGLSVLYGDIVVLRDISLEISQGELVSVVGSNGSGKSTLLRALSGLVRPASGEIWLGSERIDGIAPHLIARKGLIQVPEGKQLWPYLSVKEHLEVGSYTPEARAVRNENMALVRELFPVLGQNMDRLAHTLSGGEQQMLATARGLMAKPKLIMMDEPSLGLAPKLVNAVFKVIERLNSDGTNILLVEQNLHQALRISSRGYVLENGKIAMGGTGETLLENPELKQAYLGI